MPQSSRTRLRWLVLLGLVGSGAGLSRAKAGPAGCWRWRPAAGAASAAGAARVAPSGSVSDPSDEPVADAVTPPLGIERRIVAEPLASTPPAVEAPAAADVAADTDSLLVPDTATTEAPADPGPFPAGQSTPSPGRCSTCGGEWHQPAEPPAARRPRRRAPRPHRLTTATAPGRRLAAAGSPGRSTRSRAKRPKLFHRPDSRTTRGQGEVWFDSHHAPRRLHRVVTQT